MLRFGDVSLSGRELLGIAGLLALMVAVGQLLPGDGYFLRIATLILMYAGMAGAWNIISGYGGQVSLGHAAFFGVGSYASTLLFIHYGLSPWFGMVLAALAAGVLSFAVGLPTFRLRGHYYALATLAVAELLRVLALYFRDLTAGAVGLSIPFVLEPGLLDFQYFGSRPYFYIALAMLALTVAITYWVERGPLGFRLRALKHSHEAAEVAGVDTTRAKLQANFISAALMGAFGTFYAQFQYFIDPDTVFGFWTVSVQVAMITILGGTGTVWGPLLGAVVLVILDEYTKIVFTGELAAVSRLSYALVLMALIIYRPGGLLSLLQASWRGLGRVARNRRLAVREDDAAA